MSAIVDALLNELDDQALAELAVKLKPYLTVDQTADSWLRGADAIAEHLGCPRSRVYALTSANRLPAVKRDGSALVARKSELDEWLRNGGAKRP